MRSLPILVCSWFLIAAVSRAANAPDPVAAAAARIHASAIRGHMAFLADHLLEGRGTATRGYDLAARYVASQFAAIGLEPAGDDGTYFQQVPFLRALSSPAQSRFVLERSDRSEARVVLKPGEDLTLAADFLRDRNQVRAPLVFAGYGVTAPELGYDDYAGLDVKGKIVVVLRGAPSRFPNDQRAWHAWGRLKEQVAVKNGAIGVLSFSSPKQLERSPWPRAVRSSRIAAMRWLDEKGSPHHELRELQATGTLGPDAVRAAFLGARVPLERVFALADSSRPPRFPLPWAARIVTSTLRSRVQSPNVAALLPGSDPRLKNELVVVTAHLDHLGIGPAVEGDSIYNGACDNASGIAAMIESARALAGLPRAARRSILFLAVTGEEKGLQGSEYFTEHPSVRHRIVANVNLDMYVMLHPLREVFAFGAEHSSLGGAVERIAKRRGLGVGVDPAPEEVVFIRSDQFPFVRKGIPAVYLDGSGGKDAIGEEMGWLKQHYHLPSDDLRQKLDYQSGADFTRYAAVLTHDIANAEAPPRWNQGDFFGETFGRKKLSEAGRYPPEK